ncbi:ABC transporter permease [Paenibacillus sp. FSL H8-0548]|uniref:carbohydrate ABC transporter permease n=1 Tax=Paenibacillus sp. FSL H8-0548 TaxID=1920422 RepID=UPI00096DC36E|nr:carbohydrate ABC transporter permease [Paenibacillus sp. FSL H8-0548]OMF24530.1 ABC transporter permease [Paenibacillus sp. FSL H8-0548]
MGRKQKTTFFDVINVVFIACCVLACLAPFLHIASISLSSGGAITAGRVTLFPIEMNFDAYISVIKDKAMIRALGFTVLLTVSFTLFAMFMTTLAAYPLSNDKLKGRKLTMFFILFTMFFSGGLIPEYMLIKSLGLLDTMSVLILPGLISPFFMIIMITFFRSTIPDSLHEAAEIDGCTHFGKLFRIVLPLSLPVLATLALFYAVGRWNGFRDALFYVTDQNLYPMQLKLYQMVMNNLITEVTASEGSGMDKVVSESLKAASIMFATVPILIVYPWLQRYFVSGLTLGSVKG